MLRQTLHVGIACDAQKISFFRLAQIILRVMMLCNFPPFVGPKVISDGLTNELIIRHWI